MNILKRHAYFIPPHEEEVELLEFTFGTTIDGRNFATD